MSRREASACIWALTDAARERESDRGLAPTLPVAGRTTVATTVTTEPARQSAARSDLRPSDRAVEEISTSVTMGEVLSKAGMAVANRLYASDQEICLLPG